MAVCFGRDCAAYLLRMIAEEHVYEFVTNVCYERAVVRVRDKAQNSDLIRQHLFILTICIIKFFVQQHPPQIDGKFGMPHCNLQVQVRPVQYIPSVLGVDI